MCCASELSQSFRESHKTSSRQKRAYEKQGEGKSAPRGRLRREGMVLVFERDEILRMVIEKLWLLLADIV